MEVFDSFPLEFKKPLLSCIIILKKCNIIFFNKHVSLIQYGRSFFTFCALVAHYISISVYVSRFFTTNVSIFEQTYIFSTYMFFNQGFLKAAVTVTKKGGVSDLIIELGKIWKMDSNLTDAQIEKKKRILKRFTFFYTILFRATLIAAWYHMMASLVITLFRRFVLDQDVDLSLPFSCAYPFDTTRNWLLYIPTYVFQVFCSSRMVYYHVGSECIMITLCAQLIIMFALLREEIEHIKPKESKSEKRLQGNNEEPVDIKIIVRNHQHLIQLANLLNKNFCNMVFVNLLFTTVTVCFFGFGITVSSSTLELANNITAFLVLLSPTYVLCYYAELLQAESLGIADSAYESLWYQEDKKYQRIILNIITRAQHPCYLTSANYAPVTLNTFTKVISTTWSYFSLIRTMYSEN